MIRTSMLAIALALSSAAVAQDSAGDTPSNEAKSDAHKPNPDQVKASVEEDAQPVKRSIPFHGRTLAYTVTPGHLTIRNDKGEPTASMFYVAYTMPPARGERRPVTFLFNGGPGSSTMWLHMGSFGPIKVDASTPETIPGPPFRYGPNPDTLLDISDLVFIDAPTTGLSRTLGKAEPKDFFGVDKDLDVFTRTIQRYLSKYQRWNDPKFIIGESYGTTRAAGLSNSLLDAGVQLNGITFVSTVFNFADFQGDQALIDFLPTYAADAWYHDAIPNKPPLEQLVQQARDFASGPYALALQKGNTITDAEAQSIAQQMAQLTGLSPNYILRSHLRVDPDHFRRELLRDRHQIIGRIDSRYVGTEPNNVGEGTDYDPQGSAITGAFVGALNDYLFRDLGYKTQLVYRPNNYGGIYGSDSGWDFTHRAPGDRQQIADTSVDLATAIRQNPRMKILSVNGYYDLATPFHGAEYEFQHMALEPQLQANIRYTYYPAGHMMYTDPASADQLKADLAQFYASAM
ncbi:MAG TPA: peptidase S10 [Sphingomicrobium sp.]|jgi:carboxypeptidase C (cathepsin A)|nr:peptidase S10 [Sphingomicrobium sp.]